MKAAITVKVKGGYLTFPYSGEVSLLYLENSEITELDTSYTSSVDGKVGRAVRGILDKAPEEVPA